MQKLFELFKKTLSTSSPGLHDLQQTHCDVSLPSLPSDPEPQDLNQSFVCPIKFHTSKLLPHMEDNHLPSSALPVFPGQLASIHPQQRSSCASCLTVSQVAQHCHSYVTACGALVAPACFPRCVHLCTYACGRLSSTFFIILRSPL